MTVTCDCKNVLPQTLCHFFLEHPVYRLDFYAFARLGEGGNMHPVYGFVTLCVMVGPPRRRGQYAPGLWFCDSGSMVL